MVESYLDKDLIKKTLTLSDIENILIDLGSGPSKDDGNGNLIYQTVCHGGDSYKLYYYPNEDGGLFHCYTHCGESFDIFELVIRARRATGITITFYQAVKYVASISNKMIYSDAQSVEQVEKITDWDWINRIKKSVNSHIVIPQLSEISEHVLENFSYIPNSLWLDEGISAESMKKYQIGYWGKEHKITIPHRDMNGRLIGIRGRALDEEDILAKRKYAPLTIEGRCLKHSLGNNLYGLCQNEEAINRTGKICIVESEKSVLLGDTYYHQNNFTVAVCGSSLTTVQANIIKKLGVREVILGFDKEFKDPKSRMAEAYWQKQMKLASQLTPYCTVYILWDDQELLNQKDAPFDQGKETLELLMKNKYEITAEDIANVSKI